MCKGNIAACDKDTSPHRNTLLRWKHNGAFVVVSYLKLSPEQCWEKHVCGFRLTVYVYEA
jgi:hypothetical protein